METLQHITTYVKIPPRFFGLLKGKFLTKNYINKIYLAIKL